MNIIIVDGLTKKAHFRSMKFVPNVGMRLDLNYNPFPPVREVICEPSMETLITIPEFSKFQVPDGLIDALIFVN